MDFDLNDDEMTDWLDNQSDKIFPVNFRYCIECEQIVATLNTLDGEIHTKVICLFPDEFDLEVCYGPFTLSTPPENFESDWDLDLVEPDMDELFIINSNAEQLLADLEG